MSNKYIVSKKMHQFNHLMTFSNMFECISISIMPFKCEQLTYCNAMILFSQLQSTVMAFCQFIIFAELTYVFLIVSSRKPLQYLTLLCFFSAIPYCPPNFTKSSFPFIYHIYKTKWIKICEIGECHLDITYNIVVLMDKLSDYYGLRQGVCRAPNKFIYRRSRKGGSFVEKKIVDHIGNHWSIPPLG